MKKVLIATPSYDGKLDVWYVNALTESIKLGLADDVFFQPIYMSYDALVQRARNDLLAIAVQNDFDEIIWIDSDIEWNPQWLLKLLSYEEDVVGGACVKKSVEEQYNVKCKPENLTTNDQGLIETSNSSSVSPKGIEMPFRIPDATALSLSVLSLMGRSLSSGHPRERRFCGNGLRPADRRERHAACRPAHRPPADRTRSG